MKKNNKGNDEIEVLDFDTAEETPKEEVQKPKKENIFTRLKDNWLSLSFKQRTIIIVVATIVVLAAISVVLYLNLTKDQKSSNKKQIVVAKDNYRYEDGTLYFVVNNKDIGSYECENKNKDLGYVAYEENDDDFDETKYEDQEAIRSKIIDKKYVFVYDNEKKNQDEVILYDIKNQKVMDTYKSIKTYDLDEDNLVFIKNEDDKYGMVKFSSNKMNTEIDFEYDYLGVITENKNSEDEKIVASVDNGSFLIDYKGEKLTKTFNGDIKNYNGNYVKTKDATNKYTLYDFEANKIDGDLNYIDLLDNYYLAVDSENKLKIYDYEKTKYIEDGIELYNTDYVKTIKTKDKNEDATASYAYTYSLDNNELTLHINNNNQEETTIINLLEGLASKAYKYVSYYNGSLYFYSDEEKTTLINSYKCNNPNNIVSADSKFETCTLASDANFEDNETDQITTPASVVPIYNNRYVFIKDNDIINLVDLVDEKVLGTYSAIDTYSDSTKTDFYIENAENKFIFAKNKSNKYGLLKLNGSSVVSVYNFEYDRLEKLKDYILAYKDQKSYLLDYNTNKVTAEFDGLIRNYNGKYVKVLKDDRYYIYDFEGNLIFEDGYKYVELYDGFVALVDDSNKLSVNDYKGNLLINTILKLSSTTYYNAKDGYAKAFSITKENNNLIITCATSQNTKIEDTKVYTFDLTTKEKVS